MFSIVQLSKFIEIFQKGCFRTSYVIIVAHFQYQNILYKNQKTTNRIILGSIHAFFTKSNEFFKFFLNMDQCFSCCVAIRNHSSDMYIARLLLQRSTNSNISSTPHLYKFFDQNFFLLAMSRHSVTKWIGDSPFSSF